jgi:hypothetical protein
MLVITSPGPFDWGLVTVKVSFEPGVTWTFSPLGGGLVANWSIRIDVAPAGGAASPGTRSANVTASANR